MTAFPVPQRSRNKPEGWFGVMATALLCALFLWWWFQPEPVSAETQRDPLYWIGRARQELGNVQPSLAQRLEIIMIAEALRTHGSHDVSERLETDWLPAAWRRPPAQPPDTLPTSSDAPTPPHPEITPAAPVANTPNMAAIHDQLAQAAHAFDAIEIDRGAEMMRAAGRTAAGLPDPARIEALWFVAARQARAGLAADAIETCAQLPPAANRQPFPDWLIAELLDGDVVAPVVGSLSDLNAEEPAAIAFAAQWRSHVRRRLVGRDAELLTRHGPAADAATPGELPGERTLWAAVQANRLGEAAALAQNNPSSHLAIARLLTWLAAPPPE
ncbi:MAG: hypothetical protein ACKV19_03540 [Verrucomicrobiales bacterium]